MERDSKQKATKTTQDLVLLAETADYTDSKMMDISLDPRQNLLSEIAC